MAEVTKTMTHDEEIKCLGNMLRASSPNDTTRLESISRRVAAIAQANENQAAPAK